MPVGQSDSPDTVERIPRQQYSYYLFRAGGQYADSLTFREVMALVAAEQGRVRARWYRTHSPYFSDAHLRPECDDHGVGFGTIHGLQSRWRKPALIEPCGKEEGPLGLTPEGARALAQIRELAAQTEGAIR